VEFANNLLNFLNTYDVDGADIDWEFPQPADREYFVLLLQETRRALAPANKILSIAAYSYMTPTNGYDIPAVLKEIDFAVIMFYDLHGGGWQNYTSNHGNLRHATSRYDIEKGLKTWSDNGGINEQLVIGIPAYSRNFQLNDPNNFGVGALATFKNFGKPGEIPTTYSYNIICKNILENGWRRYYELVKSTGPYVVNGTTWAGYDDIESIKEKLLLVEQQNYGGVGFWSLDHDDHSNVCGDGTYPLIRSVCQ
jgi:chitinase